MRKLESLTQAMNKKYRETTPTIMVKTNTFRIPENLDTTQGGQAIPDQEGYVSVYAKKTDPNNHNSIPAISPVSGVLMRLDLSKNLWYAPVTQEQRDKILKSGLKGFGCGGCGKRFEVSYY